jgi:ADP-ribosylglycohydrolase
VEFCSREELKQKPVTDMTGYGTYPVPAGAWSDDSSMSLAALDSLADGKVDFGEIMTNFVKWLSLDEYTPTGSAFDVGHTCLCAIRNHLQHPELPATQCGQDGEYANGNGALMRIHPFVLYAYTKGMKYNDWTEMIRSASALTHAHERSKLGCLIYAFILFHLLADPNKPFICTALRRAEAYLRDNFEISYYTRLFDSDFANLPEDEIKSTGYVVDTLEAAVWCLLTTDSYRECVLKAVNLGGDTDTIAAVAGGLAGALYGYEGIPGEWRDTLIKRVWIEEMCERAGKKW